MTAHYKKYHVRDHSHINMPIKTSPDGESLAVSFRNVINQFSLGLKLVGITSDGGSNMERFKAILESTFDNTRFFDFRKPMFIMG